MLLHGGDRIRELTRVSPPHHASLRIGLADDEVHVTPDVPSEQVVQDRTRRCDAEAHAGRHARACLGQAPFEIEGQESQIARHRSNADDHGAQQRRVDQGEVSRILKKDARSPAALSDGCEEGCGRCALSFEERIVG